MFINISEFSAERNIDRDTVNAWIRKHPEVGEACSRKGKEKVIDTESEAYQLLEKQYPLPKPVEVINGVPKESFIKIQNELIISQKKVESLQSQLLDVQEQIATAKAQELLLEDKTNQISELKEQIDLKNDEIGNLKEQLSEEKSKGFFAKIFGRK